MENKAINTQIEVIKDNHSKAIKKPLKMAKNSNKDTFKEQMIKHIDSKEFKLKDFNKTSEKYQDYKTKDFNKLLENNHIKINIHIDTLKNDLMSKLFEKKENGFYLFENGLNKSVINHLMTFINGLTSGINQDFIKSLDDFNNNEIKNYNIKFYLKYYNRINNIMKSVLKDFVEMEF